MSGELKESEFHPSALSAFAYVKGLGAQKLAMYLECYSSCAIEGNRLGEICAETLSRIMKGEAVNDRYVLGLAWNLKQMEDKDDQA